jgi:hypothetical protein
MPPGPEHNPDSPDPTTRRVIDELMAVAHALRDTDGSYDFPVDRAGQLDSDYAMSWFPGRGGVPTDG